MKTNDKTKFLIVPLLCGVLMSNLAISIKAVSPSSTFSGSAACGVYEGPVSVQGSNATIISSDSFCDRGRSVSATARAGSVGSASITFVVTDATDTSKNPPVEAGRVTIGTKSVSVSVPSSGNSSSNNSSSNNTPTSRPTVEVKEDTRSKNNDLKSLSIDNGKLTPAFSKEVTSYKVNLPADATSITVKATASDAKANIAGTGKINLKAGNNKVEVTCTSEYGSSKKYTISVYVDEKPLIFTDYNSLKLGVVRNIDNVKAPTGFTATKVKLDGKEIPAWTNKKMNKTIVYLSNEKSEKSFYLFENGKVTSSLIIKTIDNKDVYIVDVPTDKQSMSGMKYEKLKIDNTEIMGFSFNDDNFKNYSIIYVMDEDGKMQYYQYEATQKTLQLYSNAAPFTLEEHDSKMGNMKMIAIGTGVLACLAIGYGIFITMKMRKKAD